MARTPEHKPYRSHGSGAFEPSDFQAIGDNVVFEPGVLVFHPETIRLGSNVYVGHNAILKGYYRGRIEIGDHSWIGQGCFLHGAGGISIGRTVGIGPMVKILTSTHADRNPHEPVMAQPLEFAPVAIGDGADVGVGCILLPGVTIGEGAIIGAGALVTSDIPPRCVAAGSPARVLRER